MFAEKTDKLVDELVKEGYQNAVKQYGEKYESRYQAFCVLQEEILEAWDEIDFMKRRIVLRLLDFVNNNNGIGLQNDIRNVIDMSKKAIKELAQVCAVCKKFNDTICRDYKYLD